MSLWNHAFKLLLTKVHHILFAQNSQKSIKITPKFGIQNGCHFQGEYNRKFLLKIIKWYTIYSDIQTDFTIQMVYNLLRYLDRFFILQDLNLVKKG